MPHGGAPLQPLRDALEGSLKAADRVRGGRVTLVARPVRGAELERWDGLARQKGELFQQPEWVDALGACATRVGIFDASSALIGGFVVRRMRRAGLAFVTNPPFCPGAGPFWEARAVSSIGRLEERRRILEAMAEFLEPGLGVAFLKLSSAAEDILPFRWRGFKTAVEYTYRLSLKTPAGERFASYSESRRRSIRRAEKDGLEAVVNSDGLEVAALQRDVLEKEGSRDTRTVSAIVDAARRLPGSFAISVWRDGALLSGCLVVVWNRTAYYILGGHTAVGADGGHHGAGGLALHVAMSRAAESGCEIFDFEGSTIPRVEPFIRGFGGVLTPYYSVAKAWFPLECALKLRYREHF